MQLDQSQLGKKSAYLSEYAPQLLFSIPRQLKREELGLTLTRLPFVGYDVWNHYEVSWLNLKGKPQVAIAQIIIPANSPNLIESKSMKLYFNSFNNYQVASAEALQSILEHDLTQAAGGQVTVSLYDLQQPANYEICPVLGKCIDDLDVSIDCYSVNPELLQVDSSTVVSERVYSNLLKSNCLVTHQPDWATVIIDYCGASIQAESLLKYLISFREHNEFHEQCVERIFNDIWNRCQPQALTVTARFTRRGGLDINPVRSSQPLASIANLRLIRQ